VVLDRNKSPVLLSCWKGDFIVMLALEIVERKGCDDRERIKHFAVDAASV
jgi:hypothetical protein